MFDNVIVEHPLPDDGAERSDGGGWQTKAFDCFLENYRITADGRLLKEDYHTEDRSDPTATGLLALSGRMTKVHEGWTDTGFHGRFNFYAIGSSGEWLEYLATFTHGKLESLERVPDETP